jgi:hypothetical protein
VFTRNLLDLKRVRFVHEPELILSGGASLGGSHPGPLHTQSAHDQTGLKTRLAREDVVPDADLEGPALVVLMEASAR